MQCAQTPISIYLTFILRCRRKGYWVFTFRRILL